VWKEIVTLCFHKELKLKKKTIYFAGLLANVDSSVVNVKLDYGFEIEAIPEKKGTAFIGALENLPSYDAARTLLVHYPLISSQNKYFAISNSLVCEYDAGMEDRLFGRIAEFDNKLVYGYLQPVLRLMRLFSEGNICMPLAYFFHLKRGIPKAFIKTGTIRYISREPYSLEHSKILDLEDFIRHTKLPFDQDFLELAFENFELSYNTQDMNLSFLSLMTGLEALLNPGEQEIAYTIARNTAVILGRNKAESEGIYREVRELYRKRSRIVHVGRRIITQEDLLKLRSYVRESIKEIHRLGKGKKALLDLLNSLGFGQKP